MTVNVSAAADMANMVKAYIQVLPPGVGRVEFQYNPEEYTITEEATWRHTEQPAEDEGGTPQFQGNRPQKMEVKILLDQFAIAKSAIGLGKSPTAIKAILRSAMKTTDLSKGLGDPKPPTVMYGWGTDIILEEAYITTLSETRKRFFLGRPVVTELTVGLEAVPTVLPATNPTSGGLAERRTHTVAAGDTLASIAYSEFRNPGRWRALAELNQIDDPMRIKPGMVLLIPDLAEVEQFN